MNKFKNFKLRELVVSDTAIKLGIENIPDFDEVYNLSLLVFHILQPLRTWYGKSIKVNSGFRSKQLNVAIKGAKNSDHMYGYAVDIDAGSVKENKKLFEFIRDNLVFRQLIWENKGAWIHVSYNRDDNKKQVLEIG